MISSNKISSNEYHFDTKLGITVTLIQNFSNTTILKFNFYQGLGPMSSTPERHALPPEDQV